MEEAVASNAHLWQMKQVAESFCLLVADTKHTSSKKYQTWLLSDSMLFKMLKKSNFKC